jgi:DNA-binding transcriptional regulator YiaG
MPNVAKLLKDEICRLAKKELKSATSSLKRDVVRLKRTAAEFKRALAQMKRENSRLLKQAKRAGKDAPQVPEEIVARARVTGKMIRSVRLRLGLSQAELAKLLGVTDVSVYQWEHKPGRLTFRGDTKREFLAIRGLTKKEVAERLAS